MSLEKCSYCGCGFRTVTRKGGGHKVCDDCVVDRLWDIRFDSNSVGQSTAPTLPPNPPRVARRRKAA